MTWLATSLDSVPTNVRKLVLVIPYWYVETLCGDKRKFVASPVIVAAFFTNIN